MKMKKVSDDKMLFKQLGFELVLHSTHLARCATARKVVFKSSDIR
jgi:hypothetical protein